MSFLWNWAKNLLKKYLSGYLHRPKFGAAVQVAQVALAAQHQHAAAQGFAPKIADVGYKVFSQFEEDGIIAFLIAVLDITPKTFVEIGADDGINSNCANLALNFGWHGLYIDGNSQAVQRGRYFYAKNPTPWHQAPIFENALVTPTNINEMLEKHKFTGNIGVLSIDIDGNDYHIWAAIAVAQPALVIIETFMDFGYEADFVTPYGTDQVFSHSPNTPHGASVQAMIRLARHKGYRLVGSNALGFNLIFVHKRLGKTHLVPTVEY